MTEYVASAESRERTVSLLTDLWSRNKPLLDERLELLDCAGTQPLTEEARTEARGVAHKLAGSLGMFGLTKGTELARELELLLEDRSCRPDDIARLTGQLRAVVSAKS